MGSGPSEGVWGACATCGAATAPNAVRCPLCGAEGPIAASEIGRVSPKVRRRLRATRLVRALAVVGVVVALAFALIPAALSGPPNVADPMNTAGAVTVGPGNSTAVVSGEITGGDYVLGNYSSVSPYGASVVVSVYNASGWQALLTHRASAPVWSLPAQPSGRIIFSATVSDTYTFVLSNPYPASAGVSVTVYVATEYQSNVGSDGFG